jgi:hypothetical protein
MKTKNKYYVWVYTVFGWQRYEVKDAESAKREVLAHRARAYCYDTHGKLNVKNY